jgi:predicted NAD/FAD-binding protein
LTVNDQPQWYTVTGGSREYIRLLTRAYKDKIRLSCGVRKVIRDTNAVTLILEDGSKESFEQVIFACHADQALKIIDTPTDEEKDVIGAFQYQNNKVVVHSDLNFMPSDKSCWASWVYLSESYQDKSDSVALSYWMNNLQNFKTAKPVIITLNPSHMPKEDLIYDVHHFNHPVFSREAIEAQEKIADIQGVNNCWYVGAYQRYGFHEDGLLSTVNVMKKIGVDIPWR